MNILISNDDGYLATGIQTLTQALKPLGNLYVVAPNENKSAASSSLSVNKAIHIEEISSQVYAVHGTPSDCVHLALTGMIKTRFDLVVSGINLGANLGDDVIYSGTVAAAIEGRFLGLPSLAISLNGYGGKHFDSAAMVTKILLENIKATRLATNTILNVNVPDIPYQAIKGIQTTRLGQRHPSEQSFADKNNKNIFRIGENGKEADNGAGTDFYAVNHNFVSVTPLQIDLTKYDEIEPTKQWLDSIGARFGIK